MRKYLFSLLFAFIILINPIKSYGQARYDLPCPIGNTQAFTPLVTQNPQTGNLKANACIDPTGTVTYQGLNPNTNGVIDPTQSPYNVKADAKAGNDGSATNTLSTFSSTNQSCSTSDLGKLIIVVNSANGYPFGTGLNTITGCSGASWTVSTTSNITQSNMNWAIGSSNGAGLQAAFLAALAARKQLALPCGTMIVESPPFIAPATQDLLTQWADIQGCLSSVSGFILHPQITSTLLSNGGNIFAFSNASQATGSVFYPGLGPTQKAENLFLTSLSGNLPGTGGKVFNIFSGYNTAHNIAMQGIGLAAGNLQAIVSSSGEAHLIQINLQNFTPVGSTTGIVIGGQGVNLVEDSIFAFGGLASAVNCQGGSYCDIDNIYIIQTNQGILAAAGGSTIKVTGSTISVSGGSGSAGAISDNGNSTTFYVFGNALIATAQASFPAISLTNAASALDISGSNLSSATSGFIASGTGTFNDRGGNNYSSPLTQFTGTFVPIGGGSMSTNKTSGATNFGSNLASQTIVTTVPASSTIQIKVGYRQSVLGTTCGAGSNTTSGTLSWTSGGLAQTATIPTLTIAANGAIGTSGVYLVSGIHADINTSITFTTTSALASAGCTVVPAYVADFSL